MKGYILDYINENEYKKLERALKKYNMLAFKQLNFDLYLTNPQLKHLKSIMNAMISKGFNGKVSDIAELASARHRTSITRFLSNSSWDEKLLEKSLKAYIVEWC